MTINEWTTKIGDWHRRAFPWAKLPHVMEKLEEERHEAVIAWAGVGGASERQVQDELADCLICVLAAMAREGIDTELALAAKFEQVIEKYRAEEPELPL
jgi:NTP pyrophosphatase (non-canonical NTP hydrolase)